MDNVYKLYQSIYTLSEPWAQYRSTISGKHMQTAKNTHTHTHRHHLGMAPGVQTMFKPPTVELLRSAAQSLHLFLRVPLTEPLHVADLQWPLDR